LPGKRQHEGGKKTHKKEPGQRQRQQQQNETNEGTMKKRSRTIKNRSKIDPGREGKGKMRRAANFNEARNGRACQTTKRCI
jgi:hypothetical protein